MKEKLGFYRPAAAAFLAMMAMAVTSSTLSFFLEPVCSELGIGKGSFSLIFSLMTISGAATNPILGRIAGKKGVRGILAVTALWGCGSLLLFSVAKQLWLVYLAGFLLGLFGSNCVALCGNVIVQNAYDPRQASAILGIVMSGSGVGGMIFNIVIPAVMAASTWQRAMAVMAFCWLGVVGASFLLLGREKPMEQYTGGAGVGLGMTQAEALRSPQLYMLIAHLPHVNTIQDCELKAVAEAFGLPVLARLPINPDVAFAYDSGMMENVNTDGVAGVIEALERAE